MKIHNKLIRKNSILAMLLMFISTFALAQQTQSLREDFTEKELETFVELNKEIAVIEEQSQQNVVQAIQDEGMELERFNEMAQAQQDPEREIDATAEEFASFNAAAQKIIKERQEVQEKVVSIIEAEDDIDVQTFQQIMLAYRQSPKVQGKINKMLQDGN